MKITNFELIETRENRGVVDRIYIAEVDVTTGFFIWKKTERKRICREYAQDWFWEDDGQHTPANDVEALARSYRTRTGKEC